MNPSVTCYIALDKVKSATLCGLFARGCGGNVSHAGHLEDGDAFFYGVHSSTAPIWQAAKAAGRNWYYCDNAYFDCVRERYYRITRNAFQISERARPDFDRFKALGVHVKPWRTGGDKIVVVLQSPDFMSLVGFKWTAWLEWVMQELQKNTDRPIEIREWQRDKRKASASYGASLKGAWSVVTHMSAAATEAVLRGVPAVVTGSCAAQPVASLNLSEIETPRMPSTEEREAWAAGLAANQWTLEEIASGKAWADLQGEKK